MAVGTGMNLVLGLEQRPTTMAAPSDLGVDWVASTGKTNANTAPGDVYAREA